MTRLKIRVIIVGIVILGVLGGKPCQSSTWEATVSGDRLTIRAVAIPLRAVLARIADHGIQVQIGAGINPEVTASFANEPIANGLDRILGALNHALIWEQVESPLGPITRLAEIQVFKAGERRSMQPLPQRRHFDLVQDSKTGARFVRHELLLGLGPQMDADQFRRLLAEIGGTVLESHGGTGIYRIRIGGNEDIPALAHRLNSQEGIARAEPNWAYALPAPATAVGEAEEQGVNNVALASETAVPIAVLDSGLQVSSDLDPLIVASLDALDSATQISDTLGHGTQMALIAAGIVTPWGADTNYESAGNPVIAVRAFDDNGVTSNFTLMKSMDFAIANGARVMSLSWGTETPSPFLENTVNYGRSQGLVIVAAAGNEPTGNPYYPAAYPAVVGVGALDAQGQPWQKSNYGDFVTLAAPGFATLPVGHEGEPGTYAGTSIATAYVANRIAAAMAQNPDSDLTTILADLATNP